MGRKLGLSDLEACVGEDGGRGGSDGAPFSAREVRVVEIERAGGVVCERGERGTDMRTRETDIERDEEAANGISWG